MLSNGTSICVSQQASPEKIRNVCEFVFYGYYDSAENWKLLNKIELYCKTMTIKGHLKSLQNIIAH